MKILLYLLVIFAGASIADEGPPGDLDALDDRDLESYDETELERGILLSANRTGLPEISDRHYCRRRRRCRMGWRCRKVKYCGYKMIGHGASARVKWNRIIICNDNWDRLDFGNEKKWPGSSKNDGGLVCSAYMSKICLKWTGYFNRGKRRWDVHPKLFCKPFAEWPKYKKMLAVKKKYEEEKKQAAAKAAAKAARQPKGTTNQKGSGKTCAVLCWDSWYRGCNKVVKNGAKIGWAGSWNNQVTSLKVTKGCKLTAYDDFQFKGQKFTHTRNTGWVGRGQNDRYSSWECHC